MTPPSLRRSPETRLPSVAAAVIPTPAPVRWTAFGVVLLALLTILLRSAAPVAADDPVVRVETSVDRDVITVGDRVRLTLIVQGDPDVTLELPDTPETFGPFEVLERHPDTPQTRPDGGQTLRLEYIVTAFTPGGLTLPPGEISYIDATGARQTAVAPVLPVTVTSVLASDPSPQLRDLRPPLAIPGGADTSLRSAATTLLVAATLVLTVIILRRLPRPRRANVPLFLEPAGMAARRELEAIADDRLIERGEYEEFYRRLAVCIRQYLADQYGLPAMTSTSRELIREMTRHGVDRWLARVVTGLLNECDSVRWAGYLPAGARATQALDLAFTIVELEAKTPVGVH